ncbi:MAG TPA: hypothetical protein VF927_00100 [Solirubrobacteraceae bacterium]
MALLAELPALPLHTAGKYVAAAYIVLFAMVLVYVAIMAVRMSRTERDLGALLEELDRAPAHTQADGETESSAGGSQ